jgi:DNA-binding NarL/FixJ family response regulator
MRRLRLICPPPKVVVCTMFEDPGHVREFLGLGASAYVTKSASPEHLVDAIRAAVSDPKGEHVVVAMPRGLFREGEEGGSGGVLSAREAHILLLVARGLSNHEIAASLRLSEATVKRHLANVYPKMGVASRGRR